MAHWTKDFSTAGGNCPDCPSGCNGCLEDPLLPGCGWWEDGNIEITVSGVTLDGGGCTATEPAEDGCGEPNISDLLLDCFNTTHVLPGDTSTIYPTDNPGAEMYAVGSFTDGENRLLCSGKYLKCLCSNYSDNASSSDAPGVYLVKQAIIYEVLEFPEEVEISVGIYSSIYRNGNEIGTVFPDAVCAGSRFYHKRYAKGVFSCTGPWALDDAGADVSTSWALASFPEVGVPFLGSDAQCFDWPATISVQPTESAATCNDGTLDGDPESGGSCCIGPVNPTWDCEDPELGLGTLGCYIKPHGVGAHTSLPECGVTCSAPVRWTCDPGVPECFPDPDGIYSSEDECMASCGVVAGTWDCVGGTSCENVGGGGEHATEEECQAHCTGTVGWSCNAEGDCVNDGGSFPTQQACRDSVCGAGTPGGGGVQFPERCCTSPSTTMPAAHNVAIVAGEGNPAECLDSEFGATWNNALKAYVGTPILCSNFATYFLWCAEGGWKHRLVCGGEVIFDGELGAVLCDDPYTQVIHGIAATSTNCFVGTGTVSVHIGGLG